ncbi:MAG: hypothetical protein COA58_10590 [Bacteroidetes bacterium]|nr:MAG: hypothetical protein COA58_10590 [Bacteroidota bacterium]
MKNFKIFTILFFTILSCNVFGQGIVEIHNPSPYNVQIDFVDPGGFATTVTLAAGGAITTNITIAFNTVSVTNTSNAACNAIVSSPLPFGPGPGMYTANANTPIPPCNFNIALREIGYLSLPMQFLLDIY